MAIEDILMGDETLFQNINAFNPDYMPENFNFRDSQMEGMAMCIRPAIQGKQQHLKRFLNWLNTLLTRLFAVT